MSKNIKKNKIYNILAFQIYTYIHTVIYIVKPRLLIDEDPAI